MASLMRQPALPSVLLMITALTTSAWADPHGFWPPRQPMPAGGLAPLRGLQEPDSTGEPDCSDNAAFVALSTRVMGNCCPPAGDGGPDECELPAACETTECAYEYLSFFDACHSKLVTLPAKHFRRFENFNSGCEAFVSGVGLHEALVVAGHTTPPPCVDIRGNCSDGIAGGFVSCEADFCRACPLAGQCDRSCDLCGTSATPEEARQLLCFPVTCHAPTIQAKGVVVEAGCFADGAIGDTCRLGCSTGYDEADVVEGACEPRWLEGEEVALAEYIGQMITCLPARNSDGTLAESYCQMEKIEAVLDCCEQEEILGIAEQEAAQQAAMAGVAAQPSSDCGSSRPPNTCSLGCAERWLPLLEDCEAYLSDFQSLSQSCEAKANEFLGKAPSVVTVSGLLTHPDANGEYAIASHTVGGKPYWVKLGADGQPVYYLYAVNEPHDGYAIGDDLHSYFALVESYEENPPWGEHGGWDEVTNSAGTTVPVQLDLDPGFSDDNCHEALRLYSPELTERCLTTQLDNGNYVASQSFDETLSLGSGPAECSYDCAALWYEYSEECADFLSQNYPGLAVFTARCAERRAEMQIYSVDNTVVEGGHDDHYFTAEQGLVYRIQEVPGDGLQRTELALEAEGTHHPLAERMDMTKSGAGTHSIEWDAPEHLAGLDIDVDALEGEGEYHLEASITGTIQLLSREAILARDVLLQIGCRFFDDCTFRYDSLEMRADGSSFPLKFRPTAGFTYNFTAALRGINMAAHIRLSIYPPESISTTDDIENIANLGCELPAGFARPTHDVGEITLGSFGGPSGGRQSWGEAKCAGGDAPACCEDPTRVGPPRDPCDGNYRHFPGRDFGLADSWTWTAPFTGEYFLLVTANCDVLYYADPGQPGCTETADGLDCEDDTIEECTAAVDLKITSVDAQVHLTRTFEMPIIPGLNDGLGRRTLSDSRLDGAMFTDVVDGRRTLQGGDSAPGADMSSSESARIAKRNLASQLALFRTDQQAGLAFPTAVTPFDCDVLEHRERPICRAHRSGGGHHRHRRLQASCPHADFVRREVEMMTACGLSSDAATDAAVLDSVVCPSLACAESMISLLEDCSGSIEHLAVADCNPLVDSACEHNQQAWIYYQALERSAVFANCEETAQSHAQYAEVVVQFRAPSLSAANQMVDEHQAMVDMFSQTGGACDGERSGRRRAMLDACSMELSAMRERAEAAEATAATALARADAAEAALAVLKKAQSQQDATIAATAIVEAGAWWRAPIPSGTRRREQEPARPAPTLQAATDHASGQVVACVAAPCSISGACLNNAVCQEVAAEQGGASGFHCTCVGDYYGARCERVGECASAPCQNGGVCSDSTDDASIDDGSYYCSCQQASGWEGINCEGNVDECRSSPCQNGGVCADGVNGYNCECVSGFSGGDCGLEQAWEQVGDPCDGGMTITMPSSTIVFQPDGEYEDDARCSWAIRCPSGTATLDFTEFSTEGDFDFVRVFDGADNDAQQLAELTGPFVDLDGRGHITSSGGGTFIEFTSDESLTDEGFQATYTCG